ncbi:transcription repressor OFP15-like [Cucurbita pepo subsp. pepo]|uniref:transcription repressor OFP15-like n=1 Tax=Cucurbita pepo subsp. pepo TaxID=3664 RepID=UPI000C9D8661|nr:transcription repressor OFP15-like [Cucurbita pepo subsp. pepo]
MLTKKKKKKMMMMMKLPSLFKSSGLHHNDKSAWPWPSCRQPRTLSFRTTTAAAATATESSDSFFTLSSESSGSFSTASECSGGDPIERMIRGLRSTERLLFEPAGKSRSILKEEKKAAVPPPLKEGTTVVSMDSDDPFWDFRKSMEEMVEAYGLRDWKSLEELLSWYLSVNGKNNHGFIIGAFLDLLVSLAMAAAVAAAASSSSSSISSSSSFLPCVSSSMEIEEITSLDEHHHHHVFF